MRKAERRKIAKAKHDKFMEDVRLSGLKAQGNARKLEEDKLNAAKAEYAEKKKKRLEDAAARRNGTPAKREKVSK